MRDLRLPWMASCAARACSCFPWLKPRPGPSGIPETYGILSLSTASGMPTSMYGTLSLSMISPSPSPDRGSDCGASRRDEDEGGKRGGDGSGGGGGEGRRVEGSEDPVGGSGGGSCDPSGLDAPGHLHGGMGMSRVLDSMRPPGQTAMPLAQSSPSTHVEPSSRKAAKYQDGGVPPP